MAFFIDSAGNVVEGPDDARTAAALGYAPASKEQVASAQANAAREAEFGATGSLVRGELEGAARGLTFGASDLAARALGADAEDMAARREFSSGVGEFAGALAPIVLSGGTGALGSAARLAPTAVLSGVSERAGAAVAKRLFGETVEAGALKTMARGAVQGGVTEVVEGIPYGASELLTEASIGDEELSAEKVAGHLGLSAVLGGALGAGFGGGAAGVGVALKKAGESLGGLRDRFVREYPGYIAPRAGTTPEMVEYAMGRRVDLDKGASMKEIVADKIPAPAVPVAEVMQGPIPPIPEPGPLPPKFEKREFVPTEAPPAPFTPDPVPPEAVFGGVTPTVLGKAPKAQYAQDFRKAVDAVMTDMEELSKKAHKEFRPAEIAPLINANTPVETAQAEATRLAQLIDGVARVGAENGADRFSAAAVTRLTEIRDGLLRNAFDPDQVPLSLRGAVETGVDQSGTVGRRESVVRTGANPNGEPVLYEVIESDDLIPSHNPKTWRERSDYPAGVQERPYSTSQGEQVKVTQVQQQFDPSLPLANTVTAVDGPPIVTGGAKRIVLGGNGRTMGMQLAFESPAAAKAYRDELTRRASSFGIDPASFAKMKKPVLVRTVAGLTDASPVADLTAAGRRYNESLTRGMDAMARGVSDAKMLSPASVDDVASLFDSAPDRTFGQLLAERGKEIITALRRDKIITDQNAAEWISAADRLTSAGKDRVEAMFFGRVLGSPERYARVKGDLSARLERAIPYLVKVESKNPGLAETAVVRQAIDLLGNIEASGGKKSLAMAAGQGGLAGIDAGADPVVVAMARLLSESSAADVSKSFRAWSKRASQPTDLAAKSLSREESRRLLMGMLANDVPTGRIGAEVLDPDAGKAAAFAAPVGGAPSAASVPSSAAPVAGGVTPYATFSAINDAKTFLWDSVIGPLRRGGQGGDGLRDKRTIDAVTGLWAALRDSTEDSSVWGEAAAKHAEMNAASHAYMVDADNFFPKVTGKVKEGAKKVREGSTKKSESFVSAPAPEDLAKLARLIQSATRYRDVIEASAQATKADMNRLFGDEALANIAKTVEAEQALKGFRAEQVGKAQLAKEAKAAFKERQALAEQVFEREEALRRKAVARERELAKKASEQEIEQAKLKVASFKADIDAGEADYATRRKEYDELSALRKAEIKAQDKALRAAAKWNGLTDTVGAMISVQAPLLAPLFVGYRAMKYMGSPDKAIRTLAMLERYAETISKAIDTSADLLVRGKVAQAGRVIGQLSLNHELLRQWSNDPETLVEKLNEQTEGVASDMPRLANGVQMTTARAAQFLATKLPPKDVTPFAEDDREPTDAELAPFRTALSVIESPVLLMQLASTGQLTTDHVEAVQAVYPALLQDMRVRTMEALARAGTKPPFAVRQSLSILLGQDLDGSIAQLASNQAVYAAGGADKPAPPRRPSSRESTPSTADNYRPPSQRMESP